MRYSKSFWLQAVLVAAVGTGTGLAYKQHKQAEIDWQATHYRLHEDASYSLRSGVPFQSQFYLDADGRRIDVPTPEGVEVDYQGATWWSVEDSGRMHLWTEDRIEVFPRIEVGT